MTIDEVGMKAFITISKEIFLSDKEVKLHRLYWLCAQTGRRYPAGVAFYNGAQGDYRLCVDAFCETKAFYLKPVSMTEGMINFRVESAVRRSEGGHRRAEIGVGHADAVDGYPIFMDIGPFDRTLVLEAVA